MHYAQHTQARSCSQQTDPWLHLVTQLQTNTGTSIMIFSHWASNIVSFLTSNMKFVLCSGKAKGPIPQDAVQALDVALKNTASNHPDCVTLPRAFFFYDREMVKTVGGGAEASCLCPALCYVLQSIMVQALNVSAT